MIVIVGAGLVAVRAIESMRASGYAGPITLVGDEPHLPYERPPLSKEALRGERAWSDLSIQPASFFAEQRVVLRLGARAVALDTADRRVTLAGGEPIDFERLLIATGSAPARIAAAGAGLDGVVTLRGLDDARALRERLLRARRVLVVGAGLVGLEVAAVARQLGSHVVIVERGSRPLERLLAGHEIAESIRALHESHGAEVRTSTTVESLEGEGAVAGAVLSDGSRLEVDLVLAAVGTRPCTAWLEGSGVALEDGVLVDERAETSVTGVFAAGDVARWRLPGGTIRLETYGHAHSQGIAVGRTLAGVPTEHHPSPAASSEQYGTRLQLVGRIAREHSVVVRGDRARGSFAALFLDGDRVSGAFAMNRPRDLLLARRLIEAQQPVSVAELARADLA